ncbi:MAG: hypothetical protein JWO46_2536 [Nocardioidaceae bacterium]|nr:hypothetical protein [Nocardioidaceae bacterium]
MTSSRQGARPGIKVNAVLCDRAGWVDGELVVEGGVRTAYRTDTFPLRIANVGLALHVELSTMRALHEHTLTIRLERDGTLLWVGDLATLGPRKNDLPRTGGRRGPVTSSPRPQRPLGSEPVVVPFCLNMSDLVLDRPGDYSLIVSVDRTDCHTTTFVVTTS